MANERLLQLFNSGLIVRAPSLSQFCNSNGFNLDKVGAHGFDGVGMLFRVGKILLLGRIVLQIVEFLSARPLCVTPPPRANRLAEFLSAADDGLSKRLSRMAQITKHRNQTSSL